MLIARVCSGLQIRELQRFHTKREEAVDECMRPHSSSRDGRYNSKQRITGKHAYMLKNSGDKITIEIVCLACGSGQSKSIGYFRNHSQLTCDGCGREITVENKQLRVSIAELERAMAHLREPYLH